MTIQHAGVQPPPVPPVHKCESIVNCQRPRLRVSRYLLHLQECAILGGAGNTQAIACFLCSAEPVVCTEILLMAVYSAFAGSLTIILHNKRVYGRVHVYTAQYTAVRCKIRRNILLYGTTSGYTVQYTAQHTDIRHNIRLYDARYGYTAQYTVKHTGVRHNTRAYGAVYGYTAVTTGFLMLNPRRPCLWASLTLYSWQL